MMQLNCFYYLNEMQKSLMGNSRAKKKKKKCLGYKRFSGIEGNDLNNVYSNRS